MQQKSIKIIWIVTREKEFLIFLHSIKYNTCVIHIKIRIIITKWNLIIILFECIACAKQVKIILLLEKISDDEKSIKWLVFK
jgi:hypothetical protein